MIRSLTTFLTAFVITLACTIFITVQAGFKSAKWSADIVINNETPYSIYFVSSETGNDSAVFKVNPEFKKNGCTLKPGHQILAGKASHHEKMVYGKLLFNVVDMEDYGFAIHYSFSDPEKAKSFKSGQFDQKINSVEAIFEEKPVKQKKGFFLRHHYMFIVTIKPKAELESLIKRKSFFETSDGLSEECNECLHAVNNKTKTLKKSPTKKAKRKSKKTVK